MSTQAHVCQIFDASPEAVFDFFGDHDKFGSLLPLPVERITDSADENPNGEGSIRLIGVGPVALEETIVRWDRPRKIQYVISKGIVPFKNYVSTIEFSETNTGKCRVDYTMQFDPYLPFSGGPIAKGMELAFGDMLKKLAKTPEKFS